MWIYLCDDYACAFDGRGGHVGRYAEAHVSLFIRERTVYQSHVATPGAVAEQGRDFAEEARGHGAVAFGNPLADVVAHEEGVHEERVLVFRLAVGCGAFGYAEAGDECYVAEFGAATGEGLDKHLGTDVEPWI